MASIIPGYEYDIFISYRQKDNKGDKWVSKFVDALKTELEATFKEDVSVYFDENPHDRLQETHNVDKSLEGKLRCLIFIPILSQTYCAPNSYAWQYEFLTFLRMAGSDSFGRDIRLRNGNVASRILPIRIHDLEQEDIKLFEKETGSVLRPMDFVFKTASGVNRPLKAIEDHPQDNLNRTFYSDQINKVANAIKDIITGMEHQIPQKEEILKEILQPASIRKENRKIKIIVAILIVLALIVIGYFLIQTLSKPKVQPEKSIAVLPFKLLSNEPDKQYLADGMMDEITLHLSKIKDLRVLGRTSTEQYRNPTKTTTAIGNELGVSYLLEGSFQKSGDDVRLIVQLIKTGKEGHVWANDYDRNWSDIFKVQSEVAQKVAVELNAVVTPEEKQIIDKTPTKNLKAYDLMLKARSSKGRDKLKLLDEALNCDSNYSAIYAEKGAWWLEYAGGWKGTSNTKEVLANALPLITKALQIDPKDANAHYALAGLQIWYFWNFEASEKEYKIAIHLDSLNAEIIHDYTDLLDAAGRFEEALKWSNKGVEADPTTIWEKGLRQYFMKQSNEAIKTYNDYISTEPDPSRYTEEARVRLYLGQYRNVISIINRYLNLFPEDRVPRALGTLAIAYLKTGKFDSTKVLLDEIKKTSQKSSAGSPSFYIAMIYAQMGEKDFAFEWLEKAYENHEIEMYWLMVEPPFEPLRNDSRWQMILKKVGFPKNKFYLRQ